MTPPVPAILALVSAPLVDLNGEPVPPLDADRELADLEDWLREPAAPSNFMSSGPRQSACNAPCYVAVSMRSTTPATATGTPWPLKTAGAVCTASPPVTWPP